MDFFRYCQAIHAASCQAKVSAHKSAEVQPQLRQQLFPLEADAQPPLQKRAADAQQVDRRIVGKDPALTFRHQACPQPGVHHMLLQHPVVCLRGDVEPDALAQQALLRGDITFQGTKSIDGRDLNENDVFEFVILPRVRTYVRPYARKAARARALAKAAKEGGAK